MALKLFCLLAFLLVGVAWITAGSVQKRRPGTRPGRGASSKRRIKSFAP